MTISQEREAFVKRLTEACEASRIVPGMNQGRYVVIAQQVGVSEQAVHKWFSGVSFPSRDRARILAKFLGVDELWLLHGRKAGMDRQDTTHFAREIEGAVLMTAGMIQLAGGTCAWPAPEDPRRGAVDFYAILKARQHAIRVCLARKKEDEIYEIEVPATINEVTAVGVIPVGRRGRFDFIRLPTENVVRLTNRKVGDYTVTVKNQDGHYTTGRHEWPVIRDFSTLAAA